MSAPGAGGAPSRRYRGLAGRMGLVSASVLVSLIAIEVALRLFGVGAYVVAFEPDPDPRLVFRPTPNLSFTDEGLLYRYNANGLRGPDFQETPAAGVARIACLGDSFTFGSMVGEESAYPAVLGRFLGARFEVINAGIAAYNTEQQAVFLEKTLLPLRPAAVVWQWFLNDIEPARIEVGSSWRNRLPRWARRVLVKSHLARWTSARLQRGRVIRVHGAPTGARALVPGTPWTQTQVDHFNALYADPARWEAMTRALLEGRDLCSRARVDLLVVLFPPALQAPARDLGPARPAYERMRAFLAAESIRHLDLTGAILTASGEIGLPEDTHYNDRGYAIAAGEIANALRDLPSLRRGG